MRSHALGQLLVAFVLGAVAGCGGSEETRLYGSVEDVYPLDYAELELMMVGPYLVVEYTRSDGGKAAKLSTDLTGITVMPNMDIDLTEEVESGPRGTLQRIVDSTILLPMERGTLTLESVPAPGEELRGRFRATLSEPSGRTMNGDFLGPVTAP